jgi:hypothetical protein
MVRRSIGQGVSGRICIKPDTRQNCPMARGWPEADVPNFAVSTRLGPMLWDVIRIVLGGAVVAAVAIWIDRAEIRAVEMFFRKPWDRWKPPRW